MAGFDQNIIFRSLEAIDDPFVISYLLNKINPILEESKRFTLETAEIFVKTFDGNFLEITRYIEFAGQVDGILN